MSRSNLYRRIPGRVLEWWSFLVPFLLGIGYICALYFKSPFAETFSISALFLMSIAATAGFGYMLNDLTDVKEDLLSGKKNIVARWGTLKSFLVLITFLVFAVAPWYFLPRSIINLSVYGFEVFLLVIYSIPPLRFKKFAIPGIIIDAFYNSVVPVFIMVTTFFVLSEAIIGNYMFQLGVLFVWSLLKGLRNILLHQLQDRKNDTRSGLITFVVRYGPLTTTNILNWLILPLETVLLTLLVVLASFFMPGFWAIYILFLLFIPLTIRIWGIAWMSRREFRRIFHFVLNDFYESWMPISALIYLSVGDPMFLILLFIHLILFPRTVLKYFTEVREINRDFKIYYQRSFWRQVWVWLAPVFDAIGRFFKYISRQIGLFFDYLLQTPRRAKNSFIFINRRYFGGNLSLIRDMMINKIRININRIKYALNGQKAVSPEYEPVNPKIIRAYNKQRSNGPSQIFCHAPYSNLTIGPNKKVAVCRFNTLPLEEGSYLQKTRGEASIANLKEHLGSNDFSHGCGYCKRNLENNLFPAVGAGQYDMFKVQKQHPTTLEFKLEHSIEDLPEWLGESIPHLHTARFMGPEPFLNKLYFKIWNEITSVNRNCIIDVYTEGNILNEDIVNILEKGLFRIRVSANELITDGTKNTNIRFFVKNSLRENIPVHLVFKLQKEFLRSLPMAFELSNQLRAFADVDLTEVGIEPLLWGMTNSETKSIYDFLKAHSPKGRGLISKINRRKYHTLLNGVFK